MKAPYLVTVCFPSGQMPVLLSLGFQIIQQADHRLRTGVFGGFRDMGVVEGYGQVWFITFGNMGLGNLTLHHLWGLQTEEARGEEGGSTGCNLCFKPGLSSWWQAHVAVGMPMHHDPQGPWFMLVWHAPLEVRKATPERIFTFLFPKDEAYVQALGWRFRWT